MTPLLLAALTACIVVVTACTVATPRPAAQTTTGFGAEATVQRTGAPHPLPQLRASPVHSVSGIGDTVGGAPQPLTGSPADYTSQGSIAWAAASYGPGYLALPEPRGTVATICGPAACVTRTSTDYGPDQRGHPERIADVSARDFPVICGVALSFGRCPPGSVTILGRPSLPETAE